MVCARIVGLGAATPCQPLTGTPSHYNLNGDIVDSKSAGYDLSDRLSATPSFASLTVLRDDVLFVTK